MVSKKDLLSSELFNDRSPNAVDAFIGRRIRQKRRIMDMSQEQLAQAAKISFQQIQKYENGKNRVSGSRLFQFSLILKTSVEYFYENIEEHLDLNKDKISGVSDNQQDDFEWEDNNKKETAKLLNAYYKIKDEKARKNFVSMLKQSASFMQSSAP